MAANKTKLETKTKKGVACGGLIQLVFDYYVPCSSSKVLHIYSYKV